MSPERRYNEKEIAAIFKQAAHAQETAQRQLSQVEGLTLAELQEIGKDVGITPSFVARAAAALDRTGPPLPPTTYFGIPISVARTVDLPGSFTDEDWDRLVVDLRETFQAAGEVRRDGSLRQWRNGNLHALIEPTADGHRLRLRTLNGNARSALLGGLTFFAIALAFLLVLVLSGRFVLSPDTLFLGLLAASGLGSMGYAAYRLPRWSALRERQMEAIAARAAERGAARAASSLRTPEAVPRLDVDASVEVPDAPPVRRPGRTRS